MYPIRQEPHAATLRQRGQRHRHAAWGVGATNVQEVQALVVQHEQHLPKTWII